MATEKDLERLRRTETINNNKNSKLIIELKKDFGIM